MADVAVASLYVPGRVILEHVHWRVEAGQYWVVGGMPASGKSDFLATAASLMRPLAGTVRLSGADLSRLHEDQRLAIQVRTGMVFGDGGRLFTNLTVAENLALPLCYHQNYAPTGAEERVQTVLKLMELESVADAAPANLNRSLRQRVALARALVLAPELLFLDNPLASVDPFETRWWIKFLRQLQEKHPILQGRSATIVVGTDNLRPWREDSLQFAFIHEGRFQVIGNRKALLEPGNLALRPLLPADWLNP
jgi:phospholipid/cholesterol/gamma-HCH transport system ATP-binding protein